MKREPLYARPHYPVIRQVTTRWSDNDIYGHVNNVAYYGWFDTVVNGWLIESGLLHFDRDPIGLVVETGCRYSAPLSYPQLIEIGLAIEHLGRSSVRYRLGVFAEGRNDASAEGHFIHVYVTRSTRQPVELPHSWRVRLSAMMVETG